MGFQAIAIQMGVAWGLGMLNKAMAGKPPRPPKPRPDDVEFPLTKIGSPVPIVYGTVRIDSPLLVWADLFAALPEPGYPGVYRYSADALFVLGVPPQTLQPGTDIPWWNSPVLRRIWVADRPVPMAIPGGVLGHESSLFVDVNIGDIGAGGRFKGFLEFFDGRADQVITSFPDPPVLKVDTAFDASAAVDRSLVPGYRNQMLLACLCDKYTVGSDATFGEQAQFPSVAAEVAVIDVDAIGVTEANPAWVIYDLMCGAVFKLGYDPDLVDLASFQACATTLASEANGCSVVISADEDIEQIINALLAQVDGAIDEDPSTGLISMRLIRHDYDIDDLRELNHTNTIDRPRVTQTGWLENANHVDVTFTHRAKAYKQDTVPAKRLSNAISQGYRPRLRTVDYPYCMTSELAGKLAARDAAILGRPLMTASATLSREFFDLRRGQAVIASWPQYNITDKVFRVLDIDRGQLADDAIRVTLVEDIFDNAAGAISPDPGVVAVEDVLPIRRRIFDEAPLWLTRLAQAQGLIADTTTPRALGIGRIEPENTAAAGYSMTSRVGAGSFVGDVIAQPNPTTAVVVTAYPYHYEPYDTVNGIVIEDVTGELADAPDFPDNIPVVEPIEGWIAGGANLIRINGELMAFETITDLGGGQYRLNNIWRGLHDTVPDDHAIDDVVYWVDYDNVGTRARSRAQVVDAQPYALSVEPGFDAPVDTITISGDALTGEVARAERALRAADFAVNALEYVAGDLGLPGAGNAWKRLDMFEGSLDATWKQRNEEALEAVRGDDATSYSVQGGALWRFYARKVGADEQLIQGPLSIGSVSTVGLLLGKAGHGAVDVLLRTDGEWGSSWQDARVRVDAHRARNLIGAGSANYVALSPWTNQTGTTTINQGTSSLERNGNGRWFQAATAVANLTVLEQVVDVSGYKPTGLRARVVWYTRNFSSDTDDHSAVQLVSGATDSTSSTVVGPTDGWKRAEHSITIPAGATSVTVRVRMTGVTNGVSLAGVSGVQLYVEQASSELITNGSFESGTFTGWTNVTGSFLADTTNEYARTGSTLRSAQGGASSITEIKQEIAIPTGYFYGAAELRLARATIAGTPPVGGETGGEAILEVLNGGGSVIATATTGDESASTWSRRIVRVDLPDAAVTLRVRLRAHGTLISEAEGGTYEGSQARFDDLTLRIHKDLDSVFERELDFTAPTRQAMPRTWQEAYLAWFTLAIPMVWDGVSVLPSARPAQTNLAATAQWSDGDFHGIAKFVGYWTHDEDALSVDSYRFSRATAGAAVDLQVDGYGEFAKADSFSVAVCFRVTERSMTLEAGLVGRRDAAGHGWGMSLDTSGRVVAAVQGTTGRTATGTIDHRDGAPHWVLMTWNGSTLTVADVAGSATNAGDPGEFEIEDEVMRIGRDFVGRAMGDIDISRVLIWDGAVITPTQFLDTIHRIGTDPNGKIDRSTGWTSSQPVWTDGESDANGATLVRHATRHVPIGKIGDSYGVSIGAANTNLVLSTNYAAGVNCGPEANVTLAQSITDPTGFARGVRVTNSVSGFGYRLTSMPIGGVAGTAYAVLWMRSVDASDHNITVRLLDSNEVAVDSEVVVVTPLWQRFDLALSWNGATPTAHLQIVCDDDTIAFDLGGVVWCGLGAAPTAYQDAAVAVGDRHGVVTETMPLQIHQEGEIEANALVNMDATGGTTIASIDNGSNVNNQRMLAIDSGPSLAKPLATLWDNTGFAVGVNAVGADWSAPRALRTRWNRLELPESLTNNVAIAEADVIEGQSSTAFTYSTSVASSKIRLGGGNTGGTISPHALLSRVVVRAREEKLS